MLDASLLPNLSAPSSALAEFSTITLRRGVTRAQWTALELKLRRAAERVHPGHAAKYHHAAAVCAANIADLIAIYGAGVA